MQLAARKRINRHGRIINAKPVHPRLVQLNRELMTERSKSFDYVYITFGGCRFRACVMASGSGFSASVQIGPRAFRHDSVTTPANALQQLAIEAKAYLASRPERERHFIRQACSN